MGLGTRDGLLRQAEYLIRTRGYSAFSFADLAESSGIRTASVHHYFPRKEDLASTLIAGYIERFAATLETIRSASPRAQERLLAYGQLFLDGFEQGMLPLCGALSAERAALPEDLRAIVSAFFALHLDWLSRVAREGVSAGDLRADLDADRAAMLLLSAIEGGSFVGWALQESAPVLSAFKDALAQMSNPTKPAP